MKHTLKIVLILLSMFFITQLIGLMVINSYTIHNDQLPYGMEPPANMTPKVSLVSIIFAIIISVALIFLLMKFRIEWLLRFWFFAVVAIAIAITINAGIFNIKYASLIAFLIALPLAFLKIFRRNILIHNLTELMIYPGIAAIFVPLLNIWTIVILLILICAYDIYAVWHAGFMQAMAKYQIQTVKAFAGFFIPYLGKKEKAIIAKTAPSKLKTKKIRVNVAILGGGDVVFPLILAGVVFRVLGLPSALLIIAGATAGLAFLFYISKKGKFYPAMPFITVGCFLALGASYILTLL